MNKDVRNAIESYCTMLPYLNYSSNPNDNRRIYNLAFQCYINNVTIESDDMVKELKKNTNINDNEDEKLINFAVNRINLMQEAIDIFDTIDLKNKIK